MLYTCEITSHIHDAPIGGMVMPPTAYHLVFPSDTLTSQSMPFTPIDSQASFKWEQGWIHSYPSCVRVGRGSDSEGHFGIWEGAVSSKSLEIPKSKKGTNQPTNQLT